MCEPIQSQITGLPSQSISPPRTISAIRPACVAFFLICPPPHCLPPIIVRWENCFSWLAPGGDWSEEDLPAVRPADRPGRCALPPLRIPLSREVRPQAGRARDGCGLPAL